MDKKRPFILPSTTYVLNTQLFKESIYITISDIDEGDGLKPFEMFFNTKDSSNLTDLQVVSKFASAIMRESDNVCLVPYELMSIMNSNGEGGYYRPPRDEYKEDKATFIPNIYYEIGEIFLEHIKSIGITCKGKTQVQTQ